MRSLFKVLGHIAHTGMKAGIEPGLQALRIALQLGGATKAQIGKAQSQGLFANLPFQMFAGQMHLRANPVRAKPRPTTYPDPTADQRSCSPLPRSPLPHQPPQDRKSTRLNSSHVRISYAVFCLK